MIDRLPLPFRLVGEDGPELVCLPGEPRATAQFDTQPEYLRIGDVAKMFGVCPTTIRKWERQGHIPTALRLPDGLRIWKRTDLVAIRRTSDERPNARVPRRLAEQTTRRRAEREARDQAIREDRSRGASYFDLHEKYGLTIGRIGQILNGPRPRLKGEKGD